MSIIQLALAVRMDLFLCHYVFVQETGAIIRERNEVGLGSLGLWRQQVHSQRAVALLVVQVSPASRACVGQQMSSLGFYLGSHDPRFFTAFR